MPSDLRPTSGGAQPSSTTFLPSQYDFGHATPNQQVHLPFPPTLRSHQAVNYEPSVGLSNPPIPPSFGGLPSINVGGPIHFDQTYFQMQTLRQQNQHHNIDAARQTISRNGTKLAPEHLPFGPSGPMNHRGFTQAEDLRSMVSERSF